MSKKSQAVFDESVAIALSPNRTKASILFDTATVNARPGDGRRKIKRDVGIRVMNSGAEILIHVRGAWFGGGKARLRVALGKEEIGLTPKEGTWVAAGTIKVAEGAETLKMRAELTPPDNGSDDVLFSIDSVDLAMT
jgi:hypothetical protein